MVGTPTSAKAESSNIYEQEGKLNKLFSELQAGFKKLEGIPDPNKQTNVLKDLTSKMQEAKRCLKVCHFFNSQAPKLNSLSHNPA